jgi:uncharacterized protein YfeS
MANDDHDPWNEPSHRHPNARKLMKEESLWSCVNELAPFGSDEGADAYVEYRAWRSENPRSNLVECISWILQGKEADYNESLVQDGAIEQQVANPDEAVLGLAYPDAFTLDATIIATVLGQLVDEGRVDLEAKPFAAVAIARQCHPLIIAEYGDDEIIAERLAILQSVQQAIDVA